MVKVLGALPLKLTVAMRSQVPLPKSITQLLLPTLEDTVPVVGRGHEALRKMGVVMLEVKALPARVWPLEPPVMLQASSRMVWVWQPCVWVRVWVAFQARKVPSGKVSWALVTLRLSTRQLTESGLMFSTATAPVRPTLSTE